MHFQFQRDVASAFQPGSQRFMKTRSARTPNVAVRGMLALGLALLALAITAVIAAQTQTLFSDNFEDGDASGWSKSGGTWTIVTDGSLVFRQSGTSADARARAGSQSWTDYSVQARVKPLAFGGASRYVGLIARAINVNHFYYLALQNGNQLVLGRRDGDTSTTLASRSFTVTTGTFFVLRLDVQGTSISAFVNGAQQLSATDSVYAAGNIGGATFFASAEFDDFLVTSGSGPAQQPPAAPAGLSASPGDQQVSLTWNSVSGATSYNVKRSTVSGGPYTTIATNVTTTSFTNTGLTNGTTFFFVVSAVNAAGESPNSGQVSATPMAAQGNPGDLFVAPNGTDGNPGTMNQPTTLASAVTRIAAGRTIFMRGGTYNLSTTVTIARGNDGTSSQPKNLSAFGTEKPVLNFSAQSFSSSNRGIQLNGSFWHFLGLEITGAGDNGLFIGGSNDVIEQCATHHNRDTGLQLGRHSSTAPQSEWPSNNLILNCTSFDNFDPDNGEDADGFACKLTTGTGNVFRGCIAHNNIDDGWDLFTKTDTGPIGPVTIENCVSYNNGTLSDGTTTASSDGNGFKLGGDSIPVNHTIRRCIAFGNKQHGITFNSNPGSITVTNNTSWGNGASNFKFDEGTHVFTNNLSFQSGQSDKHSGTDVANTNCWWINGVSTNGKGLVVSSADFVSLTPSVSRNSDGSINLGNFLKLAPGSDLINAGTPAGTDIGAIESQ
jgi:parallel beta helix pectate lyase-like protein/fibronectin type III domain protein